MNSISGPLSVFEKEGDDLVQEPALSQIVCRRQLLSAMSTGPRTRRNELTVSGVTDHDTQLHSFSREHRLLYV